MGESSSKQKTSTLAEKKSEGLYLHYTTAKSLKSILVQDRLNPSHQGVFLTRMHPRKHTLTKICLNNWRCHVLEKMQVCLELWIASEQHLTRPCPDRDVWLYNNPQEVGLSGINTRIHRLFVVDSQLTSDLTELVKEKGLKRRLKSLQFGSDDTASDS